MTDKFTTNVDDSKTLQVNDNSNYWDTTGLYYKEFPSNIKLLRYFTVLITQQAPDAIKEVNLLEQQICEIIKNAMIHGNKLDQRKRIKVWYKFDKTQAKIIVEDEGEGFKDLEKWNEFNQKRNKALIEGDFEKIEKYISWISINDGEGNGGNALFAALEYWNGGIIFTSKRNKVVMVKNFEKFDLLYQRN